MLQVARSNVTGITDMVTLCTGVVTRCTHAVTGVTLLVAGELPVPYMKY